MLKETAIKRELETVIKNVLGKDIIIYCNDYLPYYNGSNEIQIAFFIVPESLASKSFDWFPSIRIHCSIICEHDENNQIINQQVEHYVTSMQSTLKMDEKDAEEWAEEIKKLLSLYAKLLDSRDILFDELAKVRYLDYIEEE